MNLNLSSLSTILTLVATAIGGTWVFLTAIHDKLDKVNEKDHPHIEYITREEYRMHVDKMYKSMEKIDDKLDKVIFYHRPARKNFSRLTPSK